MGKGKGKGKGKGTLAQGCLLVSFLLVFSACPAKELRTAGSPSPAGETFLVAAPRTLPGPNPEYTGPVFLFRVERGGALVPLPDIPETLTANPSFPAFDSRGELFIANRHENREGGPGSISRFSFDREGRASLRGTITGGGLSSVHGLAFAPNGDLYAANLRDGTISRFGFDGKGEALPLGIFFIGGQIEGLAFNRDGDLFATAYNPPEVRRFRLEPGSERVDLIDTLTIEGADGLHGLAFSPDGQLFVTSLNDSKVYRIAFGDEGGMSVVGALSVPGGPYGVAFTPTGELFISTHLRGGIHRFLLDRKGNAVPKGNYPLENLGGIAIYSPAR